MTERNERWVMVPVEPTHEMLNAFYDAPLLDDGPESEWRKSYRAMLAAAPQQPAPQPCRDCKGTGADNGQTGEGAIPCWVCQGSGQQPAPQPLTDEQIAEEWFYIYELNIHGAEKARLLARAIERAHGIKEQP